MNEVKSPGKSGSFFYVSNGYHFIIKTIGKKEAEFMLKILPRYYHHIQSHPATLLSRYCGLHRVSVTKRKRKYFVVMINIFPPEKPLQEVYDIKGATRGRKSEQKEIQNFVVMKDLNLLENDRKIYLKGHDKEKLVSQLQDDVSFLAFMQVMDYSLLLGISDKLYTDSNNSCCKDFSISQFTLYRGSQRTDYYIGIIDILTSWSTKKRLEHYFRGFCIYRNQISTVSPAKYASRFLEFLEAHLISSVPLHSIDENS